MSERVQLIFQQQLGKVVKAYEKGMDIQDIAKQADVSPPTVSKWLRQEGYRYKRKGHYPKAMKARARELVRRGWPLERVAKLLRVEISQVERWAMLTGNPILGGERDPLRLKGAKGKRKKTGKQKNKDQAKKRPPKPHRCRKHWTEDEEKYIFQLMRRKRPIVEIYRHMRASRKRQLMIWRKLGGKGRPPNFPPRKPLPCFPEGLDVPKKLPEKEIKRLRKEAQKLAGEEDKALKALEEEYEEKHARTLALEAAIKADEERAEALEASRKVKARELRAASERLKAIEAWEKRAKKKLPPGEPARPSKKRVTAGSYEAEVLGLPVGSTLKPPKLKAKAKREKVAKTIAEWADNGQFFVVSDEWEDLHGAEEDELQLYADFLTKDGFPAKVMPSGDQPQAHFKKLWPKQLERRWLRSTDNALTFLDAYNDRKQKLIDANFSPKKAKGAEGMLRYLRDAYDAFKNPDTTARQKSEAEARMKRVWANIDPIDRALLIFWRGFAERGGTPTMKGIQWGVSAKRLLFDDEARIAKRYEKRRKKSRETDERLEAKAMLEARKRELAAADEDEGDDWE